MTNVRQILAQKKKLGHRRKADENNEENPENPENPQNSERPRERIRRRVPRRVQEEPEEDADDGSDSDDSDDSDENDDAKKTRKTRKTDHKHKKEEEPSFFAKSSTFKIVSLILLIPIVMSIPFVLSHICIFVEEKLPKHTIEFVWGLYVPIMLFVAFYVRRGKTTLSSFATHNMIYLIIALGIYNFVHVAQSVPLRYRRNALKLWLTLTNILNIVAFLIDDTDYKAQEEKEKEKERRKEERRKKREEERAAKKREIPPEELPFYKRNKAVKIFLDLIVYVVILGVLVWITFAMKQKYEDFNAENQKTWGYEGNTGADWKHDLKEDDLQDVHVAETTPNNKEETNDNY